MQDLGDGSLQPLACAAVQPEIRQRQVAEERRDARVRGQRGDLSGMPDEREDMKVGLSRQEALQETPAHKSGGARQEKGRAVG